ncbi:Transmembrane protein 14C [Rhizophlyctis rosea]|uniref:Transmembrane protein 14C n=1 Tax=Rhizophlyctis rosea TaxID=64517 RepID=A0AAD5SIN1_9FUNG|nr:Transmembrane protein 14C [Rhizophlyctis rosea]
MSRDYFAFSYAFICFVGGLIGFLKAGSIQSLVAGAGAGTALGLAATQVSANPRNVRLILVTSLLLFLLMGSRFLKGGKFMPAGLVTIISAVSLFRYGSRLGSA